MAHDLSDPLVAGLIPETIDGPGTVTAYTLAIIDPAGQDRVKLATVATLDADVAGCFMTDRSSPASPASPVCMQRGSIMPVLCDGLAPILPGDPIAVSQTSAGRGALSTLGEGFGVAVSSLPSGAPGIVRVLFTGGSGEGDAVALGDLEIFVAPGGNDAGPGTIADPLATFPEAWDRMTAGYKKRRIYLAAGSYDVPGGVYAVPPSLGSTGEPVVIIGDNTPIESGTILTVIPAGAGRLLVRTVPVAPEFAIGAALTFTNNAAQGCRVTVAHDDGTTITLVAPPTITPADGDTYTIERPASILNLQFAVANFQGGDFAMKNIKVTSPGFGVFRPSESGSLVAVENVEFDTDNIFVSVFNAHLRTTGFDILFLSPNPFSDALRPTCGVFAHGSNFNFFAFEGAAIGQPDSGALVLKDCQLIINSGSQLLAINPPPCGLRSQIRVLENSYIKTAGDPSVPGIFEAMLFPGFPAFDLRNSRGDLQSLEINNVIANGAIRVDLQSIVRVDRLTGAGSVAAGIKIRGNSQVLSGTTTPGAPGGASTCTLTGAFDLAIGLLASTYAALTVDGGLSEVNAGGPTFNRFGIQP